MPPISTCGRIHKTILRPNGAAGEYSAQLQRCAGRTGIPNGARRKDGVGRSSELPQ